MNTMLALFQKLKECVPLAPDTKIVLVDDHDDLSLTGAPKKKWVIVRRGFPARKARVRVVPATPDVELTPRLEFVYMAIFLEGAIWASSAHYS